MGEKDLLVLLLKRCADGICACVRVAGAYRDTLCCAIGFTAVMNAILHVTADTLNVVTALLLLI